MATTASNRMSDIARALALGVCALFLLGTAQADEEEGSKAQYELDIPAQELNAALQAVALASNHKLLYKSELAEGKISQALKGSYSVREAMEALLTGTDLMFEITPAAVVLIRDQEIGASNADDRVAASAAAAGGMNFVDGSLSVARAATDESEMKQGQSRTDDEEVMDPEYVSEENPRGIPEIMVIGSRRTLNMDIERTENDPQPYVVFEREAIQESGASNLEQFLGERLTVGTNSVSLAQGESIAGNTSTINLRGLGSDETLILVDGRRVAGFGFQGSSNQPDINGIPVAAVERIEVLPATASGMYGGGATGGVVNVVMRRDYQGSEVKLTYDNTFDADSARRRIDLSSGFSLEHGKTNILFAASWSDATPLLVEDRAFFRQAREHILATNPVALLNAAAPPLGATTNIRSADGSDLTLKDGNTSLGSAVTYVPIGYAGVASDGGAALLANAGEYNLGLANTAQGNGGGLGALVNAPVVKSFIGTVRRESAPWLDTFIEFAASENTGSFANSQASGAFTLPVDSLSNPFNQTIRVNTPTFGADGHINSQLKTYRAAAGVIIELPRRWSAGADYTWNLSEFSSRLPERLDRAAALAAITSGSLDILRDTNEFGADFSDFLFAGPEFPSSQSTLGDATIRISGALPWSLPGGEPTLSVLVEHREEEFDDFYQILPSSPSVVSRTLYPSRSREVDSIYAEARLPLVSESDRVKGINLLELQLALRHDMYRTDSAKSVSLDANLIPLEPLVRILSRLESTDPTIALRYQPVPDITLRASYGTGFLPPAMNQLVPSLPRTFPGAFFNFLTDPLRGNEVVGLNSDITTFSHGGGDLQPERSDSFSAGMIITPELAAGLRFSIDWTRIRKNNNISQVAFLRQSDFESEGLVPGLVVRGPVPPNDAFGVGPVIGFNLGPFNIAEMNVEALDFALDYQLVTQGLGNVDVSIAATKVVSLNTQLTEASPVVEYAGVGSNASVSNANDGGGLSWRGNARLAWKRNGVTLGWGMRYFDSYFLTSEQTVVPNQGSSTVPSQAYHDLFGSYSFPSPSVGKGIFSDMDFQFGVRNIFNKHPPIDVVGNGFSSPGYSFFGDPRLASYWVSIRKQLGGD